MKTMLRCVGWMYVLGAAYYGLTSVAALLRGGTSGRGEMELVVASIWLGGSGLGLVNRRAWGWWGAIAFFLVCSGAHLNRIVSSVVTDAAQIAPLVWAVGHVTLLSVVRRGVEASADPRSITADA